MATNKKATKKASKKKAMTTRERCDAYMIKHSEAIARRKKMKEN